jgi:hypothetical protein
MSYRHNYTAFADKHGFRHLQPAKHVTRYLIFGVEKEGSKKGRCGSILTSSLPCLSSWKQHFDCEIGFVRQIHIIIYLDHNRNNKVLHKLLNHATYPYFENLKPIMMTFPIRKLR